MPRQHPPASCTAPIASPLRIAKRALVFVAGLGYLIRKAMLKATSKNLGTLTVPVADVVGPGRLGGKHFLKQSEVRGRGFCDRSYAWRVAGGKPGLVWNWVWRPVN